MAVWVMHKVKQTMQVVLKNMLRRKRMFVNLYKCVTKQSKYPWSIGCFKAADPIFAACETYINHCK